MAMIEVESLLIGIGVGLFAGVCVCIIDYIKTKLKEKHT